MNFKLVSRIFSLILLLEAIFMLPAVGIALFRQEQNALFSFLLSIGATLAGAGLFALISIKAKKGSRD